MTMERVNEMEERKKRKAVIKRRKRGMEIRISTWNIRTMLAPGRVQEIETELMRYNIEVAALQEIRWKGQGLKTLHHTIFW